MYVCILKNKLDPITVGQYTRESIDKTVEAAKGPNQETSSNRLVYLGI